MAKSRSSRAQGGANTKDKKMGSTMYNLKFRPDQEYIYFVYDPSTSGLMFFTDDLERDEYVEEVMMLDYNEHGTHFDGHSATMIVTGVATHQVRHVGDDLLKWGLCHLGADESGLG